MAKLDLKKLNAYAALGAFWIMGTIACPAQDLSLGGVSDPQVLVSPSLKPPENPLDTSLVNIKAVDAPALLTADGKTGIGAQQRFGQGIIIDAEGIIATNRHIIGQAQHIYVMLSGGKIVEANLLRNGQTDLCLIKINVPFPLTTMPLADPSEIQIGNNVTAIANASLNHQQKLDGQIIKVYKGASSNKAELMEMNIPLHPGDSGGPVLNGQGSLLGVIMGKQISDPSKSYAIPSNQIQLEYFKYRNSIVN